MLLTGTVLFLAGILKLMDPVGAGLQMSAYFQFFHVAFLSPLSGPVSWLMSMLEAVLGAAAITGIRRKPFGALTWYMLLFFTLLTLVLWFVDPPMECGCFGEAVHLTHSQSLLKNIVLLVLWTVVCLPFGHLDGPGMMRQAGFAVASTFALLFSIFCFFTIPPVDFTSMNPGSELVTAGTPALSFYDASGEYADSLATEGKVVLVSVYDPDRLSERQLADISAFTDMVEDAGLRPIVLCASAQDELPEGAYSADRRTLMTLNRSNGGAVYVSDGQIIKKWSSRSCPERDDLISVADSNPMDALISANASSRNAMQGFLLFEFAVMLLL